MVQGSPLTWRGHGHPTHHRGLLTWRGVAVPTPHSSRGFVEFLSGPGGGVAQGNCRCPHVLSGEMNTREDGPGLCASGRRPLGLVVFESDRAPLEKVRMAAPAMSLSICGLTQGFRAGAFSRWCAPWNFLVKWQLSRDLS